MMVSASRKAPWDDGQDNAWDVYGAWERWFTRLLDDQLPESSDGILETLDGVQAAYLYNLMTRLACGEFEEGGAA